MAQDQGKTGFGIGGIQPRPNISPDEMAAAAGNHTKLLQLIEQHLRNIEGKYVEQIVEQPQAINLTGAAGNFAQKIDMSTQPHNSFVIAVQQGTLNLWLGDYMIPGQTAQPNFGSFAAGVTQQFFLPLKGRVYTVVNPSAVTTLLAAIIPLAI